MMEMQCGDHFTENFEDYRTYEGEETDMGRKKSFFQTGKRGNEFTQAVSTRRFVSKL